VWRLGPADHVQNLGTLALRTRRGGLCAGGLCALLLLATLGPLARPGTFVASLAALRPLGAPFFWLAAFFKGAFSGALLGACSATAAGLSLVSAFVMVVVVILFLRVLRA